MAKAKGGDEEAAALRALIKAGYLVIKVPTPHRIINGQVRYTSSPGVDIVGTSPTGRSVLVEVKSTTSLSLPITPRLESQIAFLRLHAAQGALAMLYWNGVFSQVDDIETARVGQSLRWDLFASNPFLLTSNPNLQ